MQNLPTRGADLPDHPAICGCGRAYWPEPGDGDVCPVCRAAEPGPVADLADEPPEASGWLPLAELAKRYVEHAGRVIDHRYGLGGLLPAEVRGHALAALGFQRRLAEEALSGRWLWVAAALAHGATAGQVTRETGLDDDELVLGLGRWADGQRQIGQLTDAEHAEVLALVAEVDR